MSLARLIDHINRADWPFKIRRSVCHHRAPANSFASAPRKKSGRMPPYVCKRTDERISFA
jgi:hypothetical protein